MSIFHSLMTSSNGNIFHVTGLLCEKFTSHWWIPLQRPVTQSFDVFFDLHLNKRLSKESRRRWFETSSRSLWHHCNAMDIYLTLQIKASHCRCFQGLIWHSPLSVINTCHRTRSWSWPHTLPKLTASDCAHYNSFSKCSFQYFPYV